MSDPHSPLRLPVLEPTTLRAALNAEFHARSPLPLSSPARVSQLVFANASSDTTAERAHLAQLERLVNGELLEGSDSHRLLAAKGIVLRWELHTEFSSYTFYRQSATAESQDPGTSALEALPSEWLAAIPGELLVATHVDLQSSANVSPESMTSGLSPTGPPVVAARVADNAAWVFTNFLFEQGFSRFQILDVKLTQRQAGRTVQRLLDIETYRLLSLLALPIAKEVGNWLTPAENKLAEMVDQIGLANSLADERHVLAQLTSLATEVEHSIARTAFRFGAARAYHDLVMQRVGELRERRVAGCPTFAEIMQRRLAPAVHTCIAMADRQDELSDRLTRTCELLRTRVEVELERQNQEQLLQMNRRARLQLRLQETVEGLSVVAITYYGSQLVHYLAKGGKTLLPVLSPEIAAALSIPLIAAAAMFGIWRMRKRLRQEEEREH
ncbi:MAG: hypothetical protein AW10_00411 [Candidatus Accumulibacter appositus]|uniref:DUF3422 domain-containing protein n=1 Tax=Candidatus Accumulibacter appositus TaxID=1454003 RepID=A0A011Q0B9_9PROT|nr:DUF3422 domain-containing protein [Accumulibacter sp.]EXI82625.1 MAG: hypothetical protein AW10_00411 [Candidatus Accumulibacter appositus]HRF05330.1 DUF3422 domain-containing protein [Accumulibacter sp.]